MLPRKGIQYCRYSIYTYSLYCAIKFTLGELYKKQLKNTSLSSQTMEIITTKGEVLKWLRCMFMQDEPLYKVLGFVQRDVAQLV